MIYEWERIPVFSLPPVNNGGYPEITELIDEREQAGWQFVLLLPGQDHQIAEHRHAPVALFKREKPNA